MATPIHQWDVLGSMILPVDPQAMGEVRQHQDTGGGLHQDLHRRLEATADGHLQALHQYQEVIIEGLRLVHHRCQEVMTRMHNGNPAQDLPYLAETLHHLFPYPLRILTEVPSLAKLWRWTQ